LALTASFGFQGSDGIAPPGFLPRIDHGVGNQQKKDDEEIRPVPDHARQYHGHFDHPRDGAPEIGEEFQKRIGFLFLDLVRPVLGQPFLRLS